MILKWQDQLTKHLKRYQSLMQWKRSNPLERYSLMSEAGGLHVERGSDHKVGCLLGGCKNKCQNDTSCHQETECRDNSQTGMTRY